MYTKGVTVALFAAVLFSAAPAVGVNAKAPPPHSANQQAQTHENVSIGDLWRGL